MGIEQRLMQLVERLGSYPLWEVAIEFLLIWAAVFVVVLFVQGTRAAGALKGLLVVLVVTTVGVGLLGQGGAFGRLAFLYKNFLAIVAVALIVVFQPELRRGLIRLGETSIGRRGGGKREVVIESIVEACTYLSKQSFGGLIVIERSAGLRGLVEGGTGLDAAISSRLLQTIFFPGSALHDLAVVIKGTEITAAGVQLPLADPEDMPDPGLGSRHRAAVGLTKECDALVVVVSEETGTISLAERGRLERGLDADQLREALSKRLTAGATWSEEAAAAPGDES